MTKKLFSERELKLLPLNCLIYKELSKKSQLNKEEATFESSFHQNKKMRLLKSSYKSLTRMILD